MFDIMLKIKLGMSYILARLCTVLLVVMTLLVLWQVFSRYVLHAPSSFTEELVRYFLIWTGFVGAAYAFSTREHMALTFLRDKLPAAQRRWVTILVDAIILLFALSILVIGGVKLAIAAKMEYSALLGVPRSLVYAMAPISGVFIIVAQIVNLYEDFTGRELSTAAVQSELEAQVANALERSALDGSSELTEKQLTTANTDTESKSDTASRKTQNKED